MTGTGNGVQDFTANLKTAKALRTTGQAVFLTINIFLLYCIVDTIRQSRRENPGKGTHPTLLLLLATWPLLLIRGLYGVMSGVLPTFNYFNPDNYGESGLENSFIISEYFLGTTMEWSSCTLLILTYLTSRKDPKKVDMEMYDNGKMGQSGEAVA
jgi:peptidoglycan biosynthesis protein MviN/MurJ (putative lipid II flippase)